MENPQAKIMTCSERKICNVHCKQCQSVFQLVKLHILWTLIISDFSQKSFQRVRNRVNSCWLNKFQMVSRNHPFSTYAKFSQELTFSYPLIRTRQGVRDTSFSENVLCELNGWFQIPFQSYKIYYTACVVLVSL